MVPIHVHPLGQQQPDVDGRRAAAHQADLDDRALGRTAPRLRSTSSPPMTSSTTSTPSDGRARRDRRAGRPSQSAGERSSTRSAPSSRHAVGLARRAGDGDARADRLGDLDAAVPTPDAPAWTSAQRPLVSPPCTTSASQAVRNTSGIGRGVGRAPARPAPAAPGGRGWRPARRSSRRDSMPITAVADRPAR